MSVAVWAQPEQVEVSTEDLPRISDPLVDLAQQPEHKTLVFPRVVVVQVVTVGLLEVDQWEVGR